VPVLHRQRGRTSVAFYRDKLGFETWHLSPDREPFFAIVGRDGAMLFLKAGEAAPLPNPKRDPAMRWDAYLAVPDPDALAAEFADRGAMFSVPLEDTHDGLARLRGHRSGRLRAVLRPAEVAAPGPRPGAGISDRVLTA
jgi:catechol 2,3-dioxygenase-like lactoylglutathione lyase family enzyme